MSGHKGFGRFAKRALDIVLAMPALTLLLVPFAGIALIIKLGSTGPVFFRQLRVGLEGKPFRAWKFRTMTAGVENGLGRHVTPDDPWITRAGRPLREWGLDELPQLINVLKGEMSLVGPRPVLPTHISRYTERQLRRLEMKPGITGWALVNGRNQLSWKRRIELDIWYVDHWSLSLDFRILLRTVWVVLIRREGIYGDDDLEL